MKKRIFLTMMLCLLMCISAWASDLYVLIDGKTKLIPIKLASSGEIVSTSSNSNNKKIITIEKNKDGYNCRDYKISFYRDDIIFMSTSGTLFRFMRSVFEEAYGYKPKHRRLQIFDIDIRIPFLDEDKINQTSDISDMSD